MRNVKSGWLCFAVLSLLQFGEASALSCEHPSEPIAEGSLTEDEVLRYRSLWFAKRLESRVDWGVAVLGRFSKKSNLPFLHEEQLEAIRAQYWPPSESVQMPYQIEYTYLSAYRFEGFQLMDGRLIPFRVESIDARVSISAEYEGIVDMLPPTDSDVIGVLLSRDDGNTLEVTTSICPSYKQIEPAQLADLLECFADGECL